MKAKLEIPKGWRRLKVGTKLQKGDRIIETDDRDFFWIELSDGMMFDYWGDPARVTGGELLAVIRRVKK